MYDKLVAALRYFRCDAAACQASDLDDMTYTCSANQHSYHSSDIYHPQKGHRRQVIKLFQSSANPDLIMVDIYLMFFCSFLGLSQFTTHDICDSQMLALRMPFCTMEKGRFTVLRSLQSCRSMEQPLHYPSRLCICNQNQQEIYIYILII